MHDASKVLLGATQSSAKDVVVNDADPANFLAGKFVSLASTGAISLLKSAGMRYGVSLGKSLSDHKKTAVLRSGSDVPVILALKRARATVTITAYANLVSGTDDVVTVDGTAFTAQAGAATLGEATFQAATSNDATATSLAAQINAHATTSAKVIASASGAVVTIVAKVGGAAANAYTLAYTDNDTNVGATVSGATFASGSDSFSAIDYVTKGAKVYIDDVLGIATENLAGTTVSDAIYRSAVLTGIDESGGETTPAALVDLVGGL